ncbi:MAG: triple tyrosine motif-containing protein [Phaeodactylibacter sp.]|uniref:helix-turn-helix and ligand-binding sensor domain-containing protein n=1 Tax=Phaeodactylibacter sp. TaxID=1940289 RepID=UPI0032ECCB17
MIFKNFHISRWGTHLTFIFSFLLTVPFLSSGQPAKGIYPIQNFSPADYKAGIQNIDFAQNRDMRMFVANNLCVLSFNGKEWERYNYKSGKKNRSLAFDESSNRLYVGAQGEFGYFEQDWQYVSLTSAVPVAHQGFDEVWDVFLVGKKVYFCTFQGIYVYNGATIEVLNHQDGLKRCFAVNGKLFAQTQHGALFEINGLQLSAVSGFSPLRGILAGMVVHHQGYLLFYNSGEVEYRTPIEERQPYTALTQALAGTYVNHVLMLSDRRLAIATQTAGLFLFDPQTQVLERITVDAGLATNACLRSYQDYEGNLWVGMQNGIALIHINSPMRLIGKAIDLQGSGYEGFETREGTYFTTSSGIYFLGQGREKSRFLKGTEGPAYGIEEIGGRLYAGHHRGLFLLENGQARQVAATDGIWAVKPLQSNPNYAIGGGYFGLYLFKINSQQLLEFIRPIEGFDLSSRFFEEDRQGRIWVSQYYKGLYRLSLSPDLQSVQSEPIAVDSLQLQNEQIVLARVEDQLYLATSIGLYRLDPETSTISNTRRFSEDIDQQPIYLIAQDQKNNVHLLYDNGVGFYDKVSQDNYQFQPSSLYQLRYHLNNDLLHASVHINQGILFSANEGFVHYTPEAEDRQRIQHPIITKQVYSVSRDQELRSISPFAPAPVASAEVGVDPGTKIIKFGIEAFQFSNLNDTKFRYILKGFDEHYSPWTNTTSKEYTNLKPGTYEFRAQARSYLGKTITSQPLKVTVTPPFYLSTFAKTLYLLLALTALLALFRFQKRRFQRKTHQLEQKQQMALQKEQQKLNQIEEEKQQALSRLKQEKVQSELQHVNNLLAASTMNLVVKNEFIDSIKQALQDLKQNGKWAEAKQSLERIVKEIDINLKLQEDWEQFEYHFDKVHGDFLTRLQQAYPDLSPNEQKLCTLLRLNLNTKEIANILSISQRGVEVARYRLRKKLELEKGQNLSKFILEY